jgi:hypothetical protein
MMMAQMKFGRVEKIFEWGPLAFPDPMPTLNIRMTIRIDDIEKNKVSHNDCPMLKSN